MYKGLIQKVGFFVKQILGPAEKETEPVRKDVVFRSVRRTPTFAPKNIYINGHYQAAAERRGALILRTRSSL